VACGSSSTLYSDFGCQTEASDNDESVIADELAQIVRELWMERDSLRLQLMDQDASMKGIKVLAAKYFSRAIYFI
jgi:hypothetical protein